MNINLDQLWVPASIPIISALIGYATNYIAVKMIFRPRRPIRFCGAEMWGLIPKRQSELAASIAETVERELISHQDVQLAMDQAGFEAVIEKMVEQELKRFAAAAKQRNALLAVFLRGELLEKIRQDFLDQLRPRIPVLIDELWAKLEQKLQVRRIVEQKIAGFDLFKLESLIYRISAKELKRIEVLGGVLGFLIGLLQLLLLSIPL